MKAYVYVTLKTSVLDPQGQTIQNALRKMGVTGIESTRQGKFFTLTLAPGLTPEAAKAEVERVAKQVLTNPVIEDYTYRLED
jgi:phosphoribosylformylglycinamidine synthase PurS subunit